MIMIVRALRAALAAALLAACAGVSEEQGVYNDTLYLPPAVKAKNGWRAHREKILATTVKVCALYKAGTGWGTGMIRGGYIVTEYHVVAPGRVPTIAPGIGGIVPEEKIEEYNPDVYVLYPGKGLRMLKAGILLLDKASDLAVLRVDGGDSVEAAPAVDVNIGDEVTAIGNPQSGDFVYADAVVTGFLPMRHADGSVGVSILVTANGGIMGGFSGGGVFSEKGLIGAIEWCMPDANVCGAIPSSEIKRELGRLKK